MESTLPLVSVVIPTRDRRKFLAETVSSVLSQTYQNVEIIIVDDGSLEPVEEIAGADRSKNSIIVLRHEQGKGAPAARNTGLLLAKGEFVAFLDDDDVWQPEKLAIQVAAFSSLGREYGVVYCGYDFLVDGEVILRKNAYYGPDKFVHVVLRKCPIGSPTALVRKKYLDLVGGFDPDMPACQDWDLWMRLAKVCRFYPVEKSLAKYRVHGEQISVNIQKKIASRIMLMEKHGAALSYCKKNISFHYQRIGSLYSLAGDKYNAEKFYKLSLKSSITNLACLLHFILINTSSRLDEFLIRKFGTRNVRGHILIS